MEIEKQGIVVKKGNMNTNFFHRYENFRRHVNTIWGIKDSSGNMAHNFPKIQQRTVTFLEEAYKARGGTFIED